MNIGVIGSGFIVRVFTQNIVKFKGVHLKGIWGRHIDKLKTFNCFDYYTTDINELLSDNDIDVIYVAIPNSLHYEYALKALNANKHVILEKPFCETYEQAKHLANVAKKKKLLLYEAIMTIHNPLYIKMMSETKKLKNIKHIEANLIQYSRRYDNFKKGIVEPVFDYKLAGGALMDQGIYNIHYVVNIFGKPKSVKYYPNISRNIDTSGTLILDYKTFKASLTACKDCVGESFALIQAENGYIRCNSSTGHCSSYTYCIDNKTKNISIKDDEFCSFNYLYKEFIKIYKQKDFKKCYKYLNKTLLAQKVLEDARNSCSM